MEDTVIVPQALACSSYRPQVEFWNQKEMSLFWGAYSDFKNPTHINNHSSPLTEMISPEEFQKTMNTSPVSWQNNYQSSIKSFQKTVKKGHSNFLRKIINPAEFEKTPQKLTLFLAGMLFNPLKETCTALEVSSS